MALDWQDMLHLVVRVFFLGLVLACVFDPFDQVAELKLPLLFSFCITSLVLLFLRKDGARPAPQLAVYLALVAAVFPIWGFVNATALSNAPYGSDSFQYFKSYLFLTFAFFLYEPVEIERAIRYVVACLTALAMIIIGIFIATTAGYGEALRELGDHYKVLVLQTREYGGKVFPTIYYVTSPMIVFALAWWCNQIAMRFTWYRLALAVVCSTGLFLSGTRNNMLVAICVPLAILILTSSKRRLIFAASAVAFLLFVAVNLEVFVEMVAKEDPSNTIKIAYLPIYWELLTTPSIFIFGQGLGTRFFIPILGEYVSVTELTYLEIVRTYGVPLGLLLISLLALPALLLVRTHDARYRGIWLGIAAYLYLSILNPYIFSSNGMLLLGIVASLAFTSLRHLTTNSKSAISCLAS